MTQALDPGSAPGAIESISEVVIDHGPHASVQGWEMASWMAQRLGWQVMTARAQPGVEFSWRFLTLQDRDVRIRIRRLDSGPPEVRRVRVSCALEGKPVVINLVPEEGNRLAVVLEGVEAAPRTMIVPPLDAGELIGRQLSDRERDPVFAESMAVAQILAQSVLNAA
jgi:hypothetical protein